MMTFFLLCFCSLVLAVFTSYVLQLIIDACRRLPPGPWPLPVIGNVLHMSKLPHRSLARLAERYGPLMTVRLGTSLVVVASSPTTAREIFQTHNASLSGRNPGDVWRGGGHGANSIFVLQPGSKWRALRRLGTEQLFSPRRLEELRPLRADMVRSLLQDVSEHAASGVPAGIREMVFAATVRLLWRAMFSTELDEAASRGLHGYVRETLDLILTPNVSDMFPVLAAADLQGVRSRMATLMARLYQVVDQPIELRKRDRESNGDRYSRRNDLLDVMLDMSEQQDSSGVTMDRDVMQAFCTDLFVGASDTSSNTIEWALAELLQNPQAMRRTQEEIKLVLGSRAQVEDSDIEQLPYLQAVVKETLRLHPPLPLVSYRAKAAVQVQGFTIPEGSNVMVNLWAIHHNVDVWAEPHKFMPERFLRKKVDFLGRSFDFLPFGSGRHICLGLPLANRTLYVMLGSLLHQFNWMLPEMTAGASIDMTEKYGLVMSMATPIHIMVKKKRL